MGRPDHLDLEENWHGGFYELGLQLGPRDDDRLETALTALWTAAGVSGCYAPTYNPLRHAPADLSLESLEGHGHLRGIVRLPSGDEVVCGSVAIRFDDGDDWIELFLPLGALGSTDERIGPFPFGEPGGPVSLAWRLPIDAWLAGVATRVYTQVPFELGVIGFEAAGEAEADDLASGPPEARYFGYLLPSSNGLSYTEANR